MKEISYAIVLLMSPPEGNRYELSLLVMYGFTFRVGADHKDAVAKYRIRKDGYRWEKRLACHQAHGSVVDPTRRQLEVCR